MIKKVNKDSKKVYLVRIQPRDQITGKRINFPIKYAKNKADAAKLELHVTFHQVCVQPLSF